MRRPPTARQPALRAATGGGVGGDVGGGTWNYRTTAAGLDGKHCYSNYIHPSKKHSASAVMAGGTDKSIANPDVWAKAVVTAGAACTCNAYWGVY
ncbi:lactococcin 972 family bacteriocin [Streptomyces sp. CB02959]|uniref:lactococcin 972 family bacteriocin n=1 Tax=Streptomyces sp. CB02959 TaxID=2020330 RepID=UPI000C27E689|nr:lactococcin 972 family bacteriocin [Streptomyces sp. CB02959]PJN34383.1 lactococcin 972 family bacteriocin [Streptomyces sp. CB02959]